MNLPRLSVNHLLYSTLVSIPSIPATYISIYIHSDCVLNLPTMQGMSAYIHSPTCYSTLVCPALPFTNFTYFPSFYFDFPLHYFTVLHFIISGIHFNLCLFILSAVSSVHTSFITSTITSTLRAYQQEFQLLAEELSPGPSTGPSSEPSTKPSSGPFLDHSFEPSFVPSAEHSVQRSYSSFSIAPPPTASRFSIQQVPLKI